jgi:ABC-type polysaccharide/polyol phosphate export permease
MIISQSIVSFCAISVHNFIMITTTIYLFDIQIPEANQTYAIFLILLQTLAGLFTGLLISSLFNSYNAAQHFSNWSVFVFTITSGSIWPILGQPKLMQKISNYMPYSAALEAFRTILFKNIDEMSPVIMKAFSISLLWITIPIFLTFIIFKVKN